MIRPVLKVASLVVALLCILWLAGFDVLTYVALLGLLLVCLLAVFAGLVLFVVHRIASHW